MSGTANEQNLTVLIAWLNGVSSEVERVSGVVAKSVGLPSGLFAGIHVAETCVGLTASRQRDSVPNSDFGTPCLPDTSGLEGSSDCFMTDSQTYIVF
jgi:hypothetical protein